MFLCSSWVKDTLQLCCCAGRMPAVSHPRRRWDISFVIIVRLQNTVHGMFHRKNKWKNPPEWSNLVKLWKIDLKRRMTHSTRNVAFFFERRYCTGVLPQGACSQILCSWAHTSRGSNKLFFIITRQWRIDIHTLSKCWSHLKNSEVIPVKRPKIERKINQFHGTEQWWNHWSQD